ncbi:MAG: hypothetical protein Q9195_005354 [Heterodermia aff. obscurata]
MAPNSQSPSDRKAVVVGLYGIPGCGKSYLLKQLEQALGQSDFAFYDGSTVVADLVPGGLDAFKSMVAREQIHWRERAIDNIGKECLESGKVGIVAGHFMFWAEEQEAGRPIYTQNDMDIYSQIIYLDTPVETIAQRRQNDTDRIRPVTSVAHLQKWQDEEKLQLRHLCRQHCILFSSVPHDHALLDWVLKLLRLFRYDSEAQNLSCAERRLDEIVAPMQGAVSTMLVLDADRTLAPQDTGVIFWNLLARTKVLVDGEKTLKKLADSPLGYTYLGFRQVVLIYEELLDDEEYDAFCEEAASMVTMHPEFVALLQLVQEQEHIGAVVVTCGLRLLWEKVLAREGFAECLSVIGGGRIADGFVVTAKIKGALTARLRNIHGMYTWAFGDSPLDVHMLHEADQGIVVVGKEWDRSSGMDEALKTAIQIKGLQARQVLFPPTALPRLDPTLLPIIKISSPQFITPLLGPKYRPRGLQVLRASDTSPNAANLLATPLLHATTVVGQDLQRAHRRIGHYLAIEHISKLVRLEPSPIIHVLRPRTFGSRLFHEKRTTVVALMPRGEPMAAGINDAFPLAMVLDAHHPGDLRPQHLDGQLTVMLVDAVINTGETVIGFVRRVRELNATVRVLIVAGVVQEGCVGGGSLERALAGESGVRLVMLRTSETKFRGNGVTDMGNRLFDTMHLP